MRNDRMIAPQQAARTAAWGLALLLAFGLASTAAIGATVETPAGDTTGGEQADPGSYPRTIQKIWYRTGKDRGFVGPKHSGDLMITRRSLEFLSKKADITIPFESVGMISYGKMKGDVNTDWVVLTVQEGGTEHLIGLRDGRKLGYGARTPEIFETVLDVAEELSWGQFRAPTGLEPYTELDHVFSMAVPEGWSSYHHEMISTEGSVSWGTVVFTPEPMTGEETQSHLLATKRERELEAIQQGEVSAWVVKRMESKSGMSCDGFTDKARKTLARWIARDPFFGVPFDDPQNATFEETAIGICRGVRTSLRARPSSATSPVLELRAVSRGQTTLLIGLRTTTTDLETDLKAFEAAMPTVRFAVTR
jgi:hypothetical protein